MNTRMRASVLRSLPTRQGVSVELDVRNAGERAGAEVVQVYVQKLCGTALKPRMELKGFAKAKAGIRSERACEAES